MRYWLSVPERERSEWFIGYLYRDVPVWDPLQPLTQIELREISAKRRQKPALNIAKLTEPLDPDNWLQLIRERFGAGDYHLFLNDQHPSVKKVVKEVYFEAGRDFDNYPPIVDPATVLLNEPKNEGYLRWARLKGIKFPGDPDFEDIDRERESEDDMAATATVEKLTDALIRQTEQNSQQHRGPVVTESKSSDDTVKVMADAALKGQTILLDSIKAAQTATAKAQDPMEFHKAVMEAAKVAAPPVATVPAAPGSSFAEMLTLVEKLNAPMLALQQSMMQAEQRRAEAAEKRAEALEARLLAIQNPAAPAPGSAPAVNPTVHNPVRDAIDLIKGLASLREVAGSVLGGGAEEVATSVWERVGTKIVDAAPGMLYNLAVLKNGGTPVPPPELKAELVEAETTETPQVEGQTQTQENEPVITKARIAQELATPLITSLNNGEKGFQFAAGMMLTPKLMGFPGRVVYEMAVEQGESGMMEICQAYPPLWEQLIRIPKQFGAFLKEFMDRETANKIVADHLAAQQRPLQPEVIPPQPQHVNGEAKGRTVLDPQTGKPVQTAHKGPQVNQ